MKHHRAAIKQLKEELPGVEVRKLRQRTHCIFGLEYGGVVRHIAVSCSPKDVDYTVLNFVREAKRLLGVPK